MGCDTAQIKKNEASVPAGVQYAGINIVVTKSQNGKIEFYLYGKNPATLYVAEWLNNGQLFPWCPSTITNAYDAAAGIGAAPAKGATGTVYFSAQYLNDHAIPGRPKWPTELDGGLPSLPLRVFPQSLILIGREMETGTFQTATIDLLDPAQADARQNIVLDGHSPITVNLTATSFGLFTLGFFEDSVVQKTLSVLQGGSRDASAVGQAWSVIARIGAVLAEDPTALSRIKDPALQQALKDFLKV